MSSRTRYIVSKTKLNTQRVHRSMTAKELYAGPENARTKIARKIKSMRKGKC